MPFATVLGLVAVTVANFAVPAAVGGSIADSFPVPEVLVGLTPEVRL